MSITLKTLIIDGEGTEAKMLVADSQEDYAHLHMLATLGYQNWVNPPLTITKLMVVLDVSQPIAPVHPVSPAKADKKLSLVQDKKEGNAS